VKQSPYFKKFSFDEDEAVDQKVEKDPTRTDQYSIPARETTEATTHAVKLQKPDNEQSSSLQSTVVENSELISNGESVLKDNSKEVTSEVTIDSDMSQNITARPPPPRGRSQTMHVPRVKRRKNVPEPSYSPPPTTRTLPRDLQPVPAPRTNRSNRSISPMPAGVQDEREDKDPNVSRAKSLDNLDVASSTSDKKVTFKSEPTTIPDNTMVQPYAISEVPDILQKIATEENCAAVQDESIVGKSTEESDDHEYIEADQFNAAVVSVSELKNNKHRNSKSQVTKCSTLNTKQNGGLTMNGGIKQKAMSSGTITMNTKSAPRRHAPPPPGASRSRSLTTTSIDKIRPQGYSTTPCRPPPPSNYVNSNVKSSKVSEASVNKVPPAKPLRTPNTFDYENLNDTTTITKVEYSQVDIDAISKNNTTPTDDYVWSRPKKPVRMPKEATPTRECGDTAQPASQAVVKVKYIDLDIDQLATDQQKHLMKYQNFDDFSPRAISPELKSLDGFDALSVSLPLEGVSQVNDAILKNLNVASAGLTKFYVGKFSYLDKVTCSKWSEFDAAGVVPPGTAPCVKYNGKLLSLQVNYTMI